MQKTQLTTTKPGYYHNVLEKIKRWGRSSNHTGRPKGVGPYHTRDDDAIEDTS